MPAPLPLLRPDMPAPQQLLPYLERMHAAGYYSNFGPLVRELENHFADAFNARQGAGPRAEVVTLSSATLGLELALQAMDLAPGARVLVPALTFVATATAVLRAGHVPVVGDVDRHSWLLTPALAEQARAQTRLDAVLPVATFGLPQAMADWQAFEDRSGVPVLVDAAAGYGGQWLDGAQGTVVISLHATKSLPASEGGLLVTTDAALAARVRQLSNFGINLDPDGSVPLGSLASLGTNAKLSEYHAAVALCSLQDWPARAAERQQLLLNLEQSLQQACGQTLLFQHNGGAGAAAAPMTLCLRLSSADRRAALEHACQARQIATRRWYQPLLSQMPALAARCDSLPHPEATALAQTLLGLPFYRAMNAAEQARLCEAVQAAHLGKN